MTRSASLPLSAWPRTSWNFPIAGARSYWGILELIASWSSMVPCPEALMAPPGPFRVQKALLDWHVGMERKPQLNTCCLLLILDPLRLLRHTENQHYSFIDLYWVNIWIYFTTSAVSLVLVLMKETVWIKWFHFSLVLLLSCVFRCRLVKTRLCLVRWHG